MKCFRRDDSTMREVRSDDKTQFLGVFGLASDFYKTGVIEEMPVEDEWLYIDYPFMCSEKTRDNIIKRIKNRYPMH